MKKFFISIILLSCFLMSGCKKTAVLLNTDIKKAENILDETIVLNNLNYIHKDSKKHIYSIGKESLYSAITNLVHKDEIENGKLRKRLEGNYSCSLKTLDKKHIIIRCSDQISITSTFLAILGLSAGFKKDGYSNYFKNIKYNDLKYVSLRKYRHLKKKELL